MIFRSCRLLAVATAFAWIGPLAAYAACELDNATLSGATVSLPVPATGTYDPFEDTTIFASATVEITADCAAQDYFIALSGVDTLTTVSGATMTYSASPDLPPDSGRFRLSSGTTEFTVTATIPVQGTVPTSGTYQDAFTIELFDQATGGTAIDTHPAQASAEVASVMTITIAGTGGGGIVDFATLTEGAANSASAMVLATSNDPHRIQFSSLNEWAMQFSATENGAQRLYSIPYTVSLAGGASVSATNPDFVENLAATSAAGNTLNLDFSTTPTGDLRAGIYRDEVTVTILGQ